MVTVQARYDVLSSKLAMALLVIAVIVALYLGPRRSSKRVPELKAW
jgi:hypothetical protein